MRSRFVFVSLAVVVCLLLVPISLPQTPTATTTTLSSSLNPSLAGQSVTFTATVTPQGSGTPTGTVTFVDGSAELLQVALGSSGQAQFVSSTLSVGSHTISAVCSGDANFTSSKGTITQVVSQPPQPSTTTTLVSSPNPVYVGQALTLTATVTPQGTGTPTGTVNFLDGSHNFGVLPLANGQAVYSLAASFLGAGSHSITAQYSGDANFTSSTASLTQAISTGSTTTTLVSSLNPSDYGQSMTITATVTPQFTGTPTGTVTFEQGNNCIPGNPNSLPPSYLCNQTIQLGQVALGANGQAQFTTTGLRATLNLSTVQANYGGDANFTGSSSAIVQPVSSPASISISPVSQVLILGGNPQQYTAIGHYADGSSVVLTTLVTWSSSNPAAAAIDSSSGIASAVALGSTVITASAPSGVYGSATLGVVAPSASGVIVEFLGGGSSAMFLELGEAAQSSPITATSCVWTQNAISNQGMTFVSDLRPATPVDDYGDMWITWSPGSGTCAAPTGIFNIFAYTSLDSTVGVRCYFGVDSSGLSGCVQRVGVSAGTPGQNLLCNGLTPCQYGPDTPIPQAVISALDQQHWFAAGTDILPVDAKFATYRMLTPCGQAVLRQPFDQGLKQTYGLGYQGTASGVGVAAQSYFSNTAFNTLDFNIAGRDPINTPMTVPSYSLSTVGAKPVIVAVSLGGGTGLGAATDVTSLTLALFMEGVLGRTADFIGATVTSPVTTLMNEPLSGAYNVMEYSVPNTSQFHDSQDDNNCNGSGKVYSNPMNLQSTDGQYPAVRARVVGTSEMMNQLQAGTSSNQRLGYFLWSAPNAANFTATIGKYLTVNGVDPLLNAYTDGVLPGVDSAHPLSNVTFQGLNLGDYPIWTVERIVSQSPTPVGVESLILAAQWLNATQNNFISPQDLQVWHSHYYLPAIASGVSALGPTIYGANDLCALYGALALPESGGDAGGANVIKQANYDFCLDFGNVSGLINKAN